MMGLLPFDREPPKNAVELDRAVAAARRAADELPSEDARARRTAAVDGFAAYAALLGAAAAPTEAAAAMRPLAKPEHLYTVKLEYDDGRWDIEELRLGTAPRVGEYIEVGERGRWQVQGSQVVVAAIRSRVEREFYRCVFVGDAAAA